MRSFNVIALLGLCVCLSAANIPEGAHGFSGQVQCTVLKKGESKILVKVDKVTRLWKPNKARNPKSLVGRQIIVSEGWFKNRETGKYQPNENHVHYMKKVERGSRISLELQTGDGDRFHILELNREQRALIGKGEHGEHEEREAREHGGENKPKSNIPEGARGFSGLVRAKVISGNENGLAIRIEKVMKTWPNNKARHTESLKGKMVIVKHGWFKNKESGRWQPNEWHQKYIKKAKAGSVIDIEIGNLEGDGMNILELNREQRTLIGHPNPHGEGD